jgi:single-stranded DNA-binding protein
MKIKNLQVVALLGSSAIFAASIVSAQTTSVPVPTAAQSTVITQPQTAIQPQVTAINREMVKQPTININPEGRILIHGMTVTSVGTNSFQGTVWGINYTVNLLATTAAPMFLFKGGNEASVGTQTAQQLKVGDEVGVSGRITTAVPLVINGEVIRNYSITAPRPNMMGGENNGKQEGNDNNGKTNMMGGNNGNNNQEGNDKNKTMMNTGNNGNPDQKALLLQLLQQVQVLQKQFNDKFGTTPSTNPTGTQ